MKQCITNWLIDIDWLIDCLITWCWKRTECVVFDLKNLQNPSLLMILCLQLVWLCWWGSRQCTKRQLRLVLDLQDHYYEKFNPDSDTILQKQVTESLTKLSSHSFTLYFTNNKLIYVSLLPAASAIRWFLISLILLILQTFFVISTLDPPPKWQILSLYIKNR